MMPLLLWNKMTVRGVNTLPPLAAPFGFCPQTFLPTMLPSGMDNGGMLTAPKNLYITGTINIIKLLEENQKHEARHQYWILMMMKAHDWAGTGFQRALNLSLGIRLTNHRGGPLATVLNIDKCLPCTTGKWGLLAIFTKVCFFPSRHSRVYPEWFNYNFPWVRQIEEETSSVVPSTFFISLTDCSSPNPRAAAAAAAPRSPARKMHGGQEAGGGVLQTAWKYAAQLRLLTISVL